MENFYVEFFYNYFKILQKFILTKISSKYVNIVLRYQDISYLDRRKFSYRNKSCAKTIIICFIKPLNQISFCVQWNEFEINEFSKF